MHSDLKTKSVSSHHHRWYHHTVFAALSVGHHGLRNLDLTQAGCPATSQSPVTNIPFDLCKSQLNSPQYFSGTLKSQKEFLYLAEGVKQEIGLVEEY